MIPAVAQTLAQILVHETSLSSTEQIDFNPPSRRKLMGRSGLNLYCYSLRESLTISLGSQGNEVSRARSEDPLLRWFDVSFLVSARDHTALGEQQLLSEALTSLLNHRLLQQKFLAPELRGYGNLPLSISPNPSIDAVILWKSLGIPLCPALYVTVTIPIQLQPEPPPQEEVVSSSVF